MAKNNNQKTAIKKAKQFYEHIQKNGFDVRQMYLFGSYAKNSSRKFSDIDVAIVLKSPVADMVDVHMKLMRIAGRLDDCIVEPHPFEERSFTKNNPFAEEIMNTGIKLI